MIKTRIFLAQERAKKLAESLEFAAPETWVELIGIAIYEAQMEAITSYIHMSKTIEGDQ